MARLPWLVMLESLAYQQLMRSPTFHRAVEQVVKGVHRVRYGIPPDELGGTRIDEPSARFSQHFVDELRTQLRSVEKDKADGTRLKSPTSSTTTVKTDGSGSDTRIAEDAESAWRELQRSLGK